LPLDPAQVEAACRQSGTQPPRQVRTALAPVQARATKHPFPHCRFRAKIAQEELIKNSSIPYSIVRATQFFEFIKGIADFPRRRTPCACRLP